MLAVVQRQDLLPTSLSTPLLFALAAAALAAWIGGHLLRRRMRVPRWLTLPLGAAVGTVGVWLAFQVAARSIVLKTTWPLWGVAAIAGAAVEIIIALYAAERRTVPRRTGVALTALRVALTALVMLMIVQPVFARERQETVERYVAVLLDDSASMCLCDGQADASGKLRLAERLVAHLVDRPKDLDGRAEALGAIKNAVATQFDWLNSLKHVPARTLREELDAGRLGMGKVLAKAAADVRRQAGAIGGAFKDAGFVDPATRAAVKATAKSLATEVADRLDAIAKEVKLRGGYSLVIRHNGLTRDVGRARDALATAAATLPVLASKVDQAYYDSLDAPARERIDQAVAGTRRDLARRLLLGDGDRPGLLDTIRRSHAVRLYTFAESAARVEVSRWRAEATTAPATRPAPARRVTNLAAALTKVRADIPPESLAGVLVLSDGRHNAVESFEPAAVELGKPVCSVLIGSRRPPRDAAVVRVEAPDAVNAEDKLVVRATVELDGLQGEQATITLTEGDRTVREQTVAVPADTFGTTVELTDTPTERGIRRYRVTVRAFRGEARPDNNAMGFPVAVTDDRVRMLIVESRPRWEFRYLRNLFAGRDKTVKLQYVLLHPDHIAGAPGRTLVHASAARPADQTEATALPENEAEWLKFDVIVLGDVPREALHVDTLETLRKFVARRAGTLVVIAGPDAMPHAYAETPLAEILPVTVQASDEALVSSPEPSYHIALTDEGRGHVIMAQADTAEAGRKIWDSLPALYWRHPQMVAKPAATVLAFAMPADPPTYFAADATGERIGALRREFQRQRPLIAIQPYGGGRVMALTFDRTWRMRYRVGDTYHHTFWGQVFRWATAEKLQAGNDRVRLGADRTLYDPDQNVRVRAKLLDEDHAAIVTDDVAVRVVQDGKLLWRRKLRYVAGSEGLYEADLGALPAGRTYRLELESKTADEVLRGEGGATVATEIAVAASQDAELIELTADPTALRELARLTDGVVATPAEVDTLPEAFGKGSETHRQRLPWRLWNCWPLLLLMVLVVTCEWVYRKKAGLT